MKRDVKDDLYSKLVRCRAEWSCEVCGKYYGPGHAGLHCSHLFGRRRKSVRFDPENGSSMCYSCHQRLGEAPRVFSRWITEHLGSERADALEARANTLVKWSKADLEELKKQLRSEWRRIEALRGQGVEGRIEFEIEFLNDL